MLKISNFKSHRSQFEVSVNELILKPGEISVLLGENGSGKSTLLEAIGGFLPSDSGSIENFGNFIENLPPEKRALTILFQERALFPHMTVYENIEFALRIQKVGRKEREQKIDFWCETFHLKHLLKKLPSQLSGGEAQKTSLARALAAERRCLFLDEPLAAIDHETQLFLRSFLREYIEKNQICAMWVTHQREEADAVAKTFYKMQQGRVEFLH